MNKREEIITRLLCAIISQDNTYYLDHRTYLQKAIDQYNDMIDAGIVKDDKIETEW